MINKNSFDRSGQSKHEKLSGFINGSTCAIPTKTILIKMDIWDIVFVGSCSLQGTNIGQNKKNEEDQMAIVIAQGIIIEGVSGQVAYNIIDIDNPKNI